MRWAGHVASVEEARGTYSVLVVKPGGKSSLETPRRTCENNIKMDLKEVGWGRMDWMDMAQDRER